MIVSMCGPNVLPKLSKRSCMRKFQIGFTKAGSFSVMGARFTQDKPKTIRIDAKKKLPQIQPLISGAYAKDDKDRIAIDKELSAYWQFVRLLLHIRRLVSTVITFHVSNAATECTEIRLHYLRALDIILRWIRKYSCTATYSQSNGKMFKSKSIFRCIDENPK